MGEKAARTIGAAEAAALVQAGDWVDYGFGLSQPDAFDTALGARAPQLARQKPAKARAQCR